MSGSGEVVALFRAGRVPRHEEELELDPFLVENAAKQQAFFDAVRQALHENSQHLLTVEVRYTSVVETQKTVLEVLLWRFGFVGAAEQSKFVDLIENMLPDDYGWQRLGPPVAVALEVPGAAAEKWYISRLLRRIDFVDLPGVSPLDVEMVAANSRAQIERQLDDYVGPRRLPNAATSLADIQASSHCVAIPATIAAEKQGMRRILMHAHRLSPVVISFILAPVDSSLLRLFRPLGSYWRGLLRAAQSTHSQTANSSSPTTSSASLNDGLDRFLLATSQLGCLALRVAGKTREASLSVAQQLASNFGGMKTFQIRSYRSSQPIDILSDPWVEIPTADWVTDDWRDACDEVAKALDREWVAAPDVSDLPLRLLAWLPHLFTADEADQVLQLPKADARGMPGMETRLAPPFVAAVQNPCPVVDTSSACAPAPNAVRVGIAMPGGGSSGVSEQSGANGHSEFVARYRGAHWHTVPLVSLTKHAFIVGSTGSGKTMSALFLVRELTRLKTPFMVIEPVKTEYSDALKPFKQHFLETWPGRGLARLRFEGKPDGTASDDFLAFDPMRIPFGVSVARHASYLKACFEAAFPLDPLAALILESGIRAFYTSNPYATDAKTETRILTGACGLKLFSLGNGSPALATAYADPEPKRPPGLKKLAPSLRGFLNYFLKHFLPSVFKASVNKAQAEILENVQQMFARRLENLWMGLVGEAARCADRRYAENPDTYESLAGYLEHPTIVELDGIPDADQKALMMSFLLTYLFERRQADDFLKRNPNGLSDVPRRVPPTTGSDLKHVLIIEEAHRILAPTGGGRGADTVGMGSREKAVGLFVDMLAEIRALGQGLVIVEQIPTKIIPEAVKNTNLKVMLRLTSKDDRDYLGEAMNFTEQQKRFVTSLRARPGHGVDMVIFEEGVDQPLLLSLPLPARRPSEPWLYNEFFADTQPAGQRHDKL